MVKDRKGHIKVVIVEEGQLMNTLAEVVRSKD